MVGNYNNVEGEDEAGKLFVGGISRETTDETFKTHFAQYGELKTIVLMKDQTGTSRGFGFVTYAEPTSVATVLKARPHTLDGKQIDPKPCTPASIQKQKKMNQQSYTKTHKIFLGGISMEATKDDIQNYFERYGIVNEVTFVMDKNDPSRPHKGFGFVTFEDESSVEQAVAKHYHMIKDKRCEAKQAETNYKNKMQNRQMGGQMNMMNQQNMGMNQMNYNQGNNQMNNMGQMNNMMGNNMMNNNMMNQNQMMNNMGMNNQGYGNNNYNQMNQMSNMNQMNQMGQMNNMGGNGMNNNNMMGNNMNQNFMVNMGMNNMNQMQNRMNQMVGNYQQNKSSYGSIKGNNNRGGHGGNQGNNRNNPYNRR